MSFFCEVKIVNMKRILKELELFKVKPENNFEITVDLENIRLIHCVLTGSEGTPYANGKFHIEVYLDQNYPMAPPKIQFVTKIYHPNIDGIGRVSLEILHDKWAPSLLIRTVLIQICVILSDPDPVNAIDFLIGRHWITDKENAEQTAKEWCFLYASGD